MDSNDDLCDGPPDQCGTTGRPGSLHVCVRKPGHGGLHRAIHLGTVTILEGDKLERLYTREDVRRIIMALDMDASRSLDQLLDTFDASKS